MSVTDAQVRKMNEEYTKNKNVSLAALKAGMDRKTAAKYRDAGKLPSELKKERTWRTRTDPFASVWPLVAAMLADAPELEAKTVFEHLVEQEPGRFEEGQLRTLQRRVRDWRARYGPEKTVFFSQRHRPGEAMQTDFTWATELQITIAGVPFPHMLCHAVLPYSNWEWATICFSESMAALRHGVQEAVFRLGRRPTWHQTDHSTAATHHVGDRRQFNHDYETFMAHLGMAPRTIEVGEKEQNGDVESLNRSLKRRLNQHLLLRGSRDFATVEEYRAFLASVLDKANAGRATRIAEELAVMATLTAARVPDYSVVDVTVTKWSTIRVRMNTYSVPSRLIDETVKVRLYDDRLEVFHGPTCQAIIERLRGRHGHRIDYRHMIWSLVKKPGAFQRYRYRDDLFPSVVFRKAYDALVASQSERDADISYLRILHLAASTIEHEVEVAVAALLHAGQVPDPDIVKALVIPAIEPTVPDIEPFVPDPAEYDKLISCAGAP